MFDADSRLVEIKRGATPAAAATVVKYGYDADGQRIRKETASGTARYLIDPTITWPQAAGCCQAENASFQEQLDSR